jgi:hypothetical protein
MISCLFAISVYKSLEIAEKQDQAKSCKVKQSNSSFLDNSNVGPSQIIVSSRLRLHGTLCVLVIIQGAVKARILANLINFITDFIFKFS